MPDDYIERSVFGEEYEGVCTQSIDTNHHFSACTDAVELIRHNEDFKEKILKVQD